MSDRRRVLLVEPRAQAARFLVDALFRSCEVIGVCSRAGEAIERLWHLDGADIVIVADRLGGEMTGPQLLVFVAEHWPAVRRILLTGESLIASRLADAIVRRPASPRDGLA